MSLVNKYNFLRWDNDGSPDTTCTDDYMLPVASGDELKFQINFDTPISDDITNWELGVWLPHDAIAIRNIAALSEADVDGTNFNIYAEWELDAIPGPWFRLVIYDTGDSDAIKYWSNALKYYATAPSNTYVINYRNSYDRLNFIYEVITSYYNQFRIHGRVADRLNQEELDGYTTSNGHYVQAQDIHRVTANVQAWFLDADSHEAMRAAVSHNDFNIDDVRYYKGENTYSTAPAGAERQRWSGEIRMYLYDYTVVASNT